MKSNYAKRYSLPVLLTLIAALGIVAEAAEQHRARDSEIHDPDTLAWWHTTEALSGDSMEGRDTGSPAYQRAADYVAKRFKAAGLRPGGENGSYFQPVLLHEIAASAQGTDFTLVRPDGSSLGLKFLEDITYTPEKSAPAQLEGALTFRGYCGKEEMDGIEGKIVVCFGTQRAKLPSGVVRIANARAGHALGIVSVDDPYFTIEPPRWPAAYARAVSMRADPVKTADSPLCVMRLSATAFAEFLRGTGQDVSALLREGVPNSRFPASTFPAGYGYTFIKASVTSVRRMFWQCCQDRAPPPAMSTS